MSWLLLLPFIFQGLVIVADEQLFHRKRELPLWERIGHPLDTLSLLICFTIPLVLDKSTASLNIYLAASVFSCLSITKDEWIHAKECTGGEQWLHSLLFMLHPLVLLATWELWMQDALMAKTALLVQVVLTFIFGTYQTVYWNFGRLARNVAWTKK